MVYAKTQIDILPSCLFPLHSLIHETGSEVENNIFRGLLSLLPLIIHHREVPTRENDATHSRKYMMCALLSLF